LRRPVPTGGLSLVGGELLAAVRAVGVAPVVAGLAAEFEAVATPLRRLVSTLGRLPTSLRGLAAAPSLRRLLAALSLLPTALSLRRLPTTLRRLLTALPLRRLLAALSPAVGCSLSAASSLLISRRALSLRRRTASLTCLSLPGGLALSRGLTLLLWLALPWRLPLRSPTALGGLALR
jgi:hypothetical protein